MYFRSATLLALLSGLLLYSGCDALRAGGARAAEAPAEVTVTRVGR